MTDHIEFETMAIEAYQLLIKKSEKTLVLPELNCNITPTRLHWTNTKDFLRIIDRPPSHFFKWMQNEISDKKISWVSEHVSDGIIIHHTKRQNKKEITAVALKYVNTFITCSSCTNVNTTMTKHPKLSCYEFECLSCGFTQNI